MDSLQLTGGDLVALEIALSKLREHHRVAIITEVENEVARVFYDKHKNVLAEDVKYYEGYSAAVHDIVQFIIRL